MIPRFAIGAVILFIALWLFRVTAAWIWPDNHEATSEPLLASGIALLGIVTALLAARRPHNRFLWIVALSALASLLSAVVGVAGAGLEPSHPIGFYADAPFFAALGLFAGYGLLLYPEGYLPSRRWRPFAYAAGTGATLSVLWSLARPCAVTILQDGAGTPMCDTPAADWFVATPNPLGISYPGGEVLWGVLSGIGGLLIVIALFAGATSLFVRFRRAAGVERQQLKVLALVVAVLLPLWVLGGALEDTVVGSVLGETISLLTPVLFAAAIAVAALRYRLFDIDRLVSRTVTYGAVTGVAVGLFALLVVVPASSFGDDGTPPWLVALATLIAAGAFTPLLRRVQGIVDRRFNRARYSAQIVVDEFATRLRDPRELEAVTADLAGTVAATVHPDRLGLWVRA